MVFYDGSSEMETVQIRAICCADSYDRKNIITPEQLFSGDISDTCQAELTRQEIEERLNELEEIKQNV